MNDFLMYSKRIPTYRYMWSSLGCVFSFFAWTHIYKGLEGECGAWFVRIGAGVQDYYFSVITRVPTENLSEMASPFVQQN